MDAFLKTGKLSLKGTGISLIPEGVGEKKLSLIPWVEK